MTGMIKFTKSFWIFIGLLSIVRLSAAAAPEDPLESKIRQLTEFTQNHTDSGEDWKYLKETSDPLLAKADAALKAGRRMYALYLTVAVQAFLGGEMYLSAVPDASRTELSFLESEWQKSGETLKPALAGRMDLNFDQSTALVRALGETSWIEIKTYYDSSLEYGRNTVPDAGLFYLGRAIQQLDLARYCATLREPGGGQRAPVTNLVAEMDDLENELLSLYQPPASIDSHSIFIRASAMLKEARELHAAGFEDGALYMYLLARLRLRKVNPGEPLSEEETGKMAGQVEHKLLDSPADTSIVRMLLEMALTEVEDRSSAQGGQTARAVFEDAIPHYFAALQPPAPRPPKQAPEATVTLVRWPYT